MTETSRNTFAFVWRDGEDDKLQVKIPAELKSTIHDLSEERESPVTYSRMAGAIIEFSTESDELASQERYLNEELSRHGVPDELPTPGLSFEQGEKNIILDEAPFPKLSVEEYRGRSNKPVDASMPESVSSLLDDDAPSPRRKGWWYANAVRRYLHSPFDSRLERLETKRQLLAYVKGKEVDDPTPVYEAIREGDVYPAVHEAVFADGDAEKTVVPVDEIGQFDWSNARVSDNIEVAINSLFEAKNEVDPTNIPHSNTPRKRVPLTMAVFRSAEPEPTKSNVRAVSRAVNGDYQTQESIENIAERVWEQVKTEYGVDKEEYLINRIEQLDEDPSASNLNRASHRTLGELVSLSPHNESATHVTELGVDELQTLVDKMES